MEYRIFPVIPDGMKQAECVQYLDEQADIYLAHMSRSLVQYIWQNEPFRLRVVAASGKLLFFCGVDWPLALGQSDWVQQRLVVSGSDRSMFVYPLPPPPVDKFVVVTLALPGPG